MAASADVDCAGSYFFCVRKALDPTEKRRFACVTSAGLLDRCDKVGLTSGIESLLLVLATSF